MTRDEVLRVIAENARKNGSVIFVGNAYNARALCAIDDQAHFFYMVGSMGLCPTLAAGFSHCRRLPVIAIEGDGNALMGLSGFPVAYAAANEPFIHVVLDNGVYETTGSQKNLSSYVNIVELASGSGYEQVYNPKDLATLTTVLEKALQEKRKSFIHIATELSPQELHPRVPYHPHDITQRFRQIVEFGEGLRYE